MVYISGIDEIPLTIVRRTNARISPIGTLLAYGLYEFIAYAEPGRRTRIEYDPAVQVS